MPLGGETVGRAYVRILADGSDVPDGIEKSMKDSNPVIRKAGEEHSAAYEREWIKKFGGRAKIGQNINETLEKAFSRAKVTDAFFGGREWKKFKKRISKEFPEAGKLAVESLEQEFRKKGTLDGLNGAIDRIHAEVSKAQVLIDKEMLDRQKKFLADYSAAYVENDRRNFEAHRRMLNEAFQMDKDFNTRQRKMVTEAYRLNKQFDRLRKRDLKSLSVQYEDLLDDIRAMERGEERAGQTHSEMRKRIQDLRTEIARTSPELGKFTDSFDSLRNRVDRTNPSLDRLVFNINRAGDASGRAFGKGSRNNFLNFIGSAIGGVVRLAGIIPRAIGGLTNLGRSMSAAFTEAGGGLSGFLDAGSKLGPVLLKGATSILVVLGVMAALVFVIGPLAALISGLVAILTSLAATLSFAVVGGLVAVTALLAPLAFGVAGIGLAIAGLNDKQKKLISESLKPLTGAFKDLARETAKSTFANVEKQAKDLIPVIQGMTPLFRRVGRSISDVASGWIDALDSPGFNSFIDKLENFIPAALRKIGRIIEQTFGGLGGIFEAMIPLMDSILTSLDRSTARFQEWANSAEGQNQLVKFFDDVADSAESVSDLVLEVIDLIAVLFTNTRDSGDNIFDGLSESVSKFTDYLEANPDSIKEWAEDGERLAVALGNAALAVGELVAAFDNDDSQQRLNDFIGGVESIVNFISGAVGVVNAFTSAIGFFFSSLGFGLSSTLHFIDLVVHAPLKAIDALVRAVGRINFNNIFDGLGGSINEAVNSLRSFGARVGPILLSPFRQTVERVRSAFNELPSSVRNTINRIVGIFRTLPALARGAISNLPERVKSVFDNAVDFVRGIPGQIVGLFTGLAGRILDAIGNIDIGSLVDLSGIPFLGNGAVSKNATRADLLANAGGDAAGNWYGKVTNGARLRWVGEDGPEAIVPLARDLSRVDPSVRWLSAIAQGKIPGMASGGLSSQKTVDASGWTIVSPSADPATVAQEVVNRLFAQSF